MRTIVGFAAAVCGTGLVLVEPVWAGPGGAVVTAAIETPMGRFVAGALLVFFLPLIGLIWSRERLAERRARRDLSFMARHSPLFEWLNIQDRARDCFTRIHAAWQCEDLSGVAGHMTDAYLQNQQVVSIDSWKREGLVNRCTVRRMGMIKPLLFIHRNDDGAHHQGSRLVLSITANMQDYLVRWDSSKIVQGSKRFRNVETIWSFVLDRRQWRVANIEEGRVAMLYAKLTRQVPYIETTLLPDPPPATAGSNLTLMLDR